jgi:hydrogenase nickel incorporation protein HypB
MCDTCGCTITPGNQHLVEANGKQAHAADGRASVEVLTNLLAENDHAARHNRQHLERHGILAVNLMSSPGSGKTSLLEATIRALGKRYRIGVIEGDLATENDAERIRKHGVPAIQITTGQACHLDAHMVHDALHELPVAELDVLFIENVGNLVCPAAFDLGEAHKVVVLSITEGEDKPLKYPDMFAASSALLLNKIDLLPHVSFDVKRAIEYARRVRPGIEVLQVSATTGAGMPAWLDWVREGSRRARERRQQTVAALRRRIAELEAQVAQPR